MSIMLPSERERWDRDDLTGADREKLIQAVRYRWNSGERPEAAPEKSDSPSAETPLDWTSTRKQKPPTDDGKTPIERFLEKQKNAPPESDEDRRLRKHEELVSREESLQRQKELDQRWREMAQFHSRAGFTPIDETQRVEQPPPKQESTLGENLLLVFSGLGDVILALIGGTQAKLWVSLVMLIAACGIQILVIIKVQPFRVRKWNALLGFAVVVVLTLLWWGARPDVAALAPTPINQQMPKAQYESAAKVAVGKLVVFPPKANQPFMINTYMPNRGTLPALGLNSGAAYRLIDRQLNEEEETQGIRVATANISDPDSKSTNEIQPGDEGTFFTANNPFLGKDGYEEVITGKKKLYLFVVLKYRDSAMPPQTIAITEFCAYFTKDFTIYHTCKGHNRIFVESK
ncbi:MAG TPA: hypothetical protein VEM96_08650 [Pyrinomonadaceae bacterium]|nr:hypothetical protein [Pyrinomonadaceae bacterium]